MRRRLHLHLLRLGLLGGAAGAAGSARRWLAAAAALRAHPTVGPRQARAPAHPHAPRTPRAGVEKVYPIGEMNDYEKEAFKAMMPELAASIEKGIKFAKDN